LVFASWVHTVTKKVVSVFVRFSCLARVAIPRRWLLATSVFTAAPGAGQHCVTAVSCLQCRVLKATFAFAACLAAGCWRSILVAAVPAWRQTSPFPSGRHRFGRASSSLLLSSAKLVCLLAAGSFFVTIVTIACRSLHFVLLAASFLSPSSPSLAVVSTLVVKLEKVGDIIPNNGGVVKSHQVGSFFTETRTPQYIVWLSNSLCL
jgi:hypothetical protein